MPELSQLSIDERLVIHELISLYGHLIDQRQFSRLDEIFTDDAIFDLTGYGGKRYQGLPAIQAMMINSSEHPLAHHATNVVVLAQSGSIKVISKGLGIGAGGRVGSVTYRDCLSRTTLGWRICERHCELRKPETVPEPS